MMMIDFVQIGCMLKNSDRKCLENVYQRLFYVQIMRGTIIDLWAIPQIIEFYKIEL